MPAPQHRRCPPPGRGPGGGDVRRGATSSTAQAQGLLRSLLHPFGQHVPKEGMLLSRQQAPSQHTLQQPPAPLSTSQHTPLSQQMMPLGQLPQLPPHPSPAHCLPAQSGTQTHRPLLHVLFGQQSPSWVHALPEGSRQTPPPQHVRPLGQLVAVHAHRPLVSLQTPPGGQEPQEPLPPHPSGPHWRPAQLGAQHNPCALHEVAPGLQHAPSQQWPDDPLPQAPSGSGPSATAA